MRILSMTATFGKLEHETLTFKPGLNIIEAPNEWGKSTWCAFILAMLYGIDTRQHTTARELAAKDRYTPWSGRPMSGRMDILWRGREITLERSSKVRAPFGVFTAYETRTGIAVPELTAETCGLMLLGVERSVFSRSSFIRLSDLPVTQDEALRRRLNALVTTGDDSDAGDLLSDRLNKLKNACRSNSRNGLLPQAQANLQELEQQQEQLQTLRERKQQLLSRQQALQQHLEKLKVHKATLQYHSARGHLQRLADARTREADIRSRMEALEAQCATLPSREDAVRELEQLTSLSNRQQALTMELQLLRKPSEVTKAPFFWYEAEPEEVEDKLRDDLELYEFATSTLAKRPSPLWIVGLFLAILGVAGAFLLPIPGILAAAVGICLFVLGILQLRRLRSKQEELRAVVLLLTSEYKSEDPARWQEVVTAYRKDYEAHHAQLTAYQEERQALKARSDQLEEDIRRLCCGQKPEELITARKQAVELWDALDDHRRQLQQAEGYIHSLSAISLPAEAPAAVDTLTHSMQDTDALIADTESQLRLLQQELGRCSGKMDALPPEAALSTQIAGARARICQLNTALEAIGLAQDTLHSARLELQKRFAPQISHRAQALFSAMTGGRYDRLSLADDLSLRARQVEEDILHNALWRSDGTIDQLYLALRLAVSEALTPDAPLVLDDALVRFDDTRLQAVMQLLQQEAEQKQILLFTCQGRESKALYE